MSARFGIVTVLLVGLLASRAAWAGNDDDARAALRRGLAAFGRGDAATALAEYEQAKKLAPEANAPFLYAAEALEKLGRHGEAAANLEVYLAKNPDVSDAADVRARIAAIRAAHFPGTVRVQTEPNDARIRVDDGEEREAGIVTLPAGRHRIEARAAGRKTSTREIDVVGDKEAVVALMLAQEEPPPRSVAPVAPDASREGATSAESHGWGWHETGYAVAGTGGAFVVVGLLLDTIALNGAINDYRDASDRGDVAAASTARDDVSSFRSLTVASYATGAVLVGSGLAIAFLVPAAGGHGSKRASILPWATTAGGGLTLGGHL